MEQNTYNGWTNYETWAVALWLDNDQGSQEYWREQARYHYRVCSPDGEREHDAACLVAEQLKAELEESNPLTGEGQSASLFTDLLSAALSEVNHFEIALAWVEEIAEEIDQEEAEAAE